MVGKEQVIDLSREHTGFHQLVRRGRAAIEHQQFIANLHNMGTTETVRGRGWGTST